MFRFLNYHRDPNDKHRRVFYYREKAEAEAMKARLKAEGIEYRELMDPHKPEITYLSVAMEDFDQVSELNSEVLAQFPRKFIPDAAARLFLLIVFFVGLAVALTGYIVSHFFRVD
jgi:hypothetical protein